MNNNFKHNVTRISNRQFALLREFHKTNHMNMSQAQEWDQRAFRSFLIRGWVGYAVRSGFYLTPDGARAWETFQRTDIHRHDPSGPITRYFDPKLYGLKIAS